MNNHLNIHLRAYAARNRLTTTPAETALWARLRGGQLGVYFRRQFPLLDRYIVDFYAPAARLVVEVDGGYHTIPRCLRRDARRDRALRAAGVGVVRLTNQLVLNDIAGAVERVRCALDGVGP